MASIKKLNEVLIRQAKPKHRTYRLADGCGMYLEIAPNGSKYWRLKYRFCGKEKRLAFGVYPSVSLSAAREKARLARVQLEEGNDPGELRKQQKLSRQFSSNAFAAIANEFIKKREAEGAAQVTIEKLRWIIEQKLSPFVGKVPVSEITSAKLLAALRQIESEGLHETANRAKRVAGQVMRYAVCLGLAERDPSQDLKDALIIAKTNHRAAITEPDELRKMLINIDGYGGSPEIKAALQLTPMLFQRPGEIRHMEWSEINWKQEYWEIPAEKMKCGLHTLYLCPSRPLRF